MPVLLFFLLLLLLLLLGLLGLLALRLGLNRGRSIVARVLIGDRFSSKIFFS